MDREILDTLLQRRVSGKRSINLRDIGDKAVSLMFGIMFVSALLGVAVLLWAWLGLNDLFSGLNNWFSVTAVFAHVATAGIGLSVFLLLISAFIRVFASWRRDHDNID